MKTFNYTDIADSCGSTWYEYMKGTWEISCDSILFTGMYYTDSTYQTVKTGGCHNSGSYIQLFYARDNADTLYLQTLTARHQLSGWPAKLVR